MTRFVKARSRYTHLDFVSWDAPEELSSEATRSEDLFKPMAADDRMIFADIPPDSLRQVGGFFYHHQA